MWPSVKAVTPHSPSRLKQPTIRDLIRELRLLTGLTQERFAARLGVTFGTINRWEKGRMQPSPLALLQIRAVLIELTASPSKSVQDASKRLLKEYFLEEEEP